MKIYEKPELEKVEFCTEQITNTTLESGWDDSGD